MSRKDRNPGVRKFRRGQEFEARNRKPEVRGQEANARNPRLGSRGHSAEAGMLIYLEAEAGKPRPGVRDQEAYRQQVEDIKAIGQEIYFIISKGSNTVASRPSRLHAKKVKTG